MFQYSSDIVYSSYILFNITLGVEPIHYYKILSCLIINIRFELKINRNERLIIAFPRNSPANLYLEHAAVEVSAAIGATHRVQLLATSMVTLGALRPLAALP